MANKMDFDLAIIGGGIGGLCLALAITNYTSIPITVYEDAPKFGEIGAGIAFGPNSVRAVRQISAQLGDALDARANGNLWPEKKDVWFDFWVGMDGVDEKARARRVLAGASLGSVEHPDPGSRMVNRAQLIDELVKLLPEGIARFGKTLVDVDDNGTQGVVLKFQDGTTASHSAVIGCDGLKSRTRRALLGEDNPATNPVYTGKYCYRGMVPMEQAVTLLGEEKAKNCQAYLGYHGHMLTFPVAAGRFMNVVAFQSSKTWTHDKMVIGATKEEMMRDFGPWGEDVKNIVKLMGQSDIWALFDHPPAETYYKGRICLLGDAAHASTPFQGAGAGMAVEDAYVLGRILQAVQSADQLPLAFAAYDGVRRERTQKVVTSSRESGYIWHFEALGDDVDKIKGGLKDRLRWIWDKHLDEDVDSALKVLQSGG